MKNHELKRLLLAQFRMSAHKFNIETGRYGVKRNNILNRICKHCCSNDYFVLQSLSELPLFQPILEDEHHVLNICLLYNKDRKKAKNIMTDEPLDYSEISAIFNNKMLIRELSRYLVNCHNVRFPKSEVPKV